jgi:hypothetical protein
MIAIETRYIGATDYRGSRIRARTRDFTLVTPYDSALSDTQNHRTAVDKMVERLRPGKENPQVVMAENVGPGYIAIVVS